MKPLRKGVRVPLLAGVFILVCFFGGCMDVHPPILSQEDARAASALIRAVLPKGMNVVEQQRRLPTKDEMRAYRPPFILMGVDGEGAFSEILDESSAFIKDLTLVPVPPRLKATKIAEAKTIIVCADTFSRIVNSEGPQAGLYRSALRNYWMTFIDIETRHTSATYFLAEQDTVYRGAGNWGETLNKFLSETNH